MTEKTKHPYDQTKANILRAVGEIIRTEGYTGLYIRNIARKAKTSGKMIYYHFGSLDNLIETYIKEKDHWRVFSDDLKSQKIQYVAEDPGSLVKTILQVHFNEMERNEEMRKIITWELSQYTDILRKEADLREELGETVFKHIDPLFEKSDLDFRSVCALIVSGIYYLILHAKVNGSLFCGIDINKSDDRARLLKTINQLVDMSFEKAGKA